MKFIPTDFPELIIVEPLVIGDERGYFYESYQDEKFKAGGINAHFVQDNQSKSCYGVIRGMHYQIGEYAQAKLVRVLQGEVLDAVVDLRRSSPTFGKKFEILLSAENKKMLYIPRGFAHGFSVLSDEAVFVYKCDNYYSKQHERGMLYNDPAMEIDWRIAPEKALISEKDLLLPVFAQADYDF
ncbi:MAG: dTDP-4-dehydrorhamnose 3,5-epimerase [Sphingobacteriales bacterium]|nr:dTDP-4-dehydrorhamnose 3,5-epimerase [Sphingobacteriales bacterium]